MQRDYITEEKKQKLKLLAEAIVFDLWSEGRSSFAAVYDELCKLLWLQMLTMRDQVSDILKETSSVKGYYQLVTKARPCQDFADSLMLDENAIQNILLKLDRLAWLRLGFAERLFFLCEIDRLTCRAHTTLPGKNYDLSSAIGDAIIHTMDKARCRNVLCATSDNYEFSAQIVKRTKDIDLYGNCVICSPNKFQARNLRRILLLTGAIRSSSDEVVASIESIKSNEMPFDCAFVNTLPLIQPMRIVGDSRGFEARYLLMLRYFERLYEVLKPKGLVFSIISRNFASSDNWKGLRNEIEKKFKIRAVISLPAGNAFSYGVGSLFITFMRREEEQGIDISERVDVYIGRINLSKTAKSAETEEGIKGVRDIFGRMGDFLARDIV